MAGMSSILLKCRSHGWLAALFLSALAGGAQGQSPLLPADCKITGNLEQTATAIIAASGTTHVAGRLEGPITNPKDSLFIRGKTGPNWLGLTINLKTATDEKAQLLIRPTVDKNKVLDPSDAYFALGWQGGWGRFYVRPNATFYKPDELAKRQAAWSQLPGASEHTFTLEFRPNEKSELELWFDGQFMQVWPLTAPLTSYEIAMAPESLVESVRLAETPTEDRLILPVNDEAEILGAKPTRLEIDPKAELPAAFRSFAGRETAGVGVGGLGTFPGLASDDLQSFFWRRHAAHRLPEQCMFSVPLAIYSHAWVLCAFDDDAGKVPEFTLRVTRYAGSRGNAMADTMVRVPAEGESPDARRVGAVSMGPEGNGKSVPLWLIKVPIKNGFIEDLLHSDTKKNTTMGTPRYLDVELLDPLANAEEAEAFPPKTTLTKRAYRPEAANATSGVTVFGLELVRSPADLTVRANTGFQVFYPSDNPAFQVKVSALEAGPYSVGWEVADIDGKIVDQGAQTVTATAGQEQTITVPVKEGDGWYAARFQLADAEKTELIDYRTSFVVLPPDTRKAGLESPFYGYWFAKNQGSDVKLDEVGPLLQRLGIRRANLPDDMPESLSLKYGFTEATMSWTKPRLAQLAFRDGTKTLAEAVAMHEASIRETLALWPGVDRMLIFHESGAKGAPFPSELWGEPARNELVVVDENSPDALLLKESGATPAAMAAAAAQKKDQAEWKQNWPSRLEYLNAMARMVREKFPRMKMQYGNDGSSLGLIGELFRQKFPRELIDTIAIEDLGQTFAPERGTPGGLQSAWFLRETARKMGYADVPVTACTEWIGRMTEKLGLQKQAEWKVRDGLLALAYGFDTISLAGINDASSGYYYSIWANGGLCYRYPTMAPKPAYAAVATLTQVLDCAKFERLVPTGSTVLYAMEFQKDNGWVYALWTPRGDREVALEFPEGATRVLTDLYGRTSTINDKNVSLKTGPAVRYLSSPSRIVAAKAGEAAFPADKPPENPGQVIPLESLAEVSIVSDQGAENASKARPSILPHLKEGEFELREVEDPVMGKCLEIELKPNQPLRWPVEHEYVTLQLKTPVTTEAGQAGIWIRGNGSWGAVDLKRTGSAWLGNDDLGVRWPGDATMNFDGWNFISYPSAGPAKAGPSKVTGLTISLPRHTLYGTEMAPVENLKIRIKSIILF